MQTRTPIQGVKTVTTAGTAEQLVARAANANPTVRTIEFHAKKARGTDNTGRIYIGFSGESGAQLRALEPGETWNFVMPGHERIGLSDIWVDAATSADGVIFTATV